MKFILENDSLQDNEVVRYLKDNHFNTKLINQYKDKDGNAVETYEVTMAYDCGDVDIYGGEPDYFQDTYTDYFIEDFLAAAGPENVEDYQGDLYMFYGDKDNYVVDFDRNQIFDVDDDISVRGRGDEYDVRGNIYVTGNVTIKKL